MKRLFVLLLALVLIFTLAACGGGGVGGKTSENYDPAEPDNTQPVDAELERLKELYDGKWINEDPHDGPFTIEVLSTTGIKITYESSGSHICDLFYSSDELTSISVSLGDISLGKYNIDTQTGILTFRPNDTDAFTYTKK